MECNFAWGGPCMRAWFIAKQREDAKPLRERKEPKLRVADVCSPTEQCPALGFDHLELEVL
jgi:hypothetical protein